ncbi:MAG: preprotein translocase subunit SecG [Chthonomonadales bacterium]
MHTINVLLSICQVLIAIGLIFLIDIQPSRNEGIGASIGSPNQSSFKGKAGFEERMTEMTRNVSIAFVCVSILVMVTVGR